MSLDINQFTAPDSSHAQLASSILYNVDMNTVLGGESINREFNVTIPDVGPITNQKRSGRCWLFATLNMFRPLVVKRFNVSKFEFSENHLFFYYKLEKAYYFLTKIVVTRHKPLDSRLVSYFCKHPVGDGGKFYMAANLIRKYGVVPRELCPDTPSAEKTEKLNYVLGEKLREYALKLREDPSLKMVFLREVYVILCLCLGVPLYKDRLFTWEYEDSKKKFHRLHMTPCEFRDELGIDLDDYVSLYHDPRLPVKVAYAKEWHSNMVGVKDNLNLNAELDALKQVAINMLQNGEPVWFACDIKKYAFMDSGTLSMERDYSLAFGIDQRMSKEDRVLTQDSSTTHDMILIGVHLDSDGRPIRWKMENSWGTKSGKKGILVMSDEWFTDYVFQVVVNRRYLDKEYAEIWSENQLSGRHITLPFYDPLIA